MRFLFGATGDLAYKKILPALQAMSRRGHLDGVLSVDVGGTHVKVLVSDKSEPRQFESGRALTPTQMVQGVHRLTADWSYRAVSIGYPGLVVHERIAAEPRNLGPGCHPSDGSSMCSSKRTLPRSFPPITSRACGRTRRLTDNDPVLASASPAGRLREGLT